MNVPDQERLFKRVRRHFRQWPKRQCSGYVHGVADQDRGLNPSEDMVSSEKYGTRDTYARGYLLGYADAHGPDVEHEHWHVSPYIEIRWWKE